MANAGLEYAMKYQEITTPYPLHTTKTTTGIFIPISYLTGTDKVKVHKIYEDLNGGILEKGDIVKVTVYITANQPLQQGAFGDIIQ
ncbi:MAG: hypothetical protein LBP53_08500 [Candidatus Peribacteria bacterium]|jgi:hypothetical protein|nr:hypothetical protein [Candidatus Peribacteria bacterium]